MAEFTDGIVLVLSAQHTRRAAALRIKEKVDEAHVRLLGTVLSDREFPIPQRLYRRL
jgi:Mrp family chromosome partitioning ATPase